MKRKRRYKRKPPPPIPANYLIVLYTGLTGGGYTLPITPTNTSVGYTDSKYEEKIASMVDASNPYERHVGPLADGPVLPVSWYWISLVWNSRAWAWLPKTSILTGYPQTRYCDYFASCLTDPSVYSPQLESTARLAFLAKIREAQAEFSAPTFLGELKETIGMIKHPLRGFTRSTKLYTLKVKRYKRILAATSRRVERAKLRESMKRRLLKQHINRFTDSLEKAYLQWTYGVSPLINDVEALLNLPEMMQEELSAKRLSVTIPAPVKQFATYQISKSASQPGLVRWATSNLGYVEYSVRIRGAMKVRTTPPSSAERLRELTKFNLREVIPTAYELLPYSFLVDYFSTLGDVVNGVFTNTSDLIYATTTYRMVSKGFATGFPLYPETKPVNWGGSPPVAATPIKAYRIKRVKTDLSVRFSDLQITMPNLGQWINSAVLGTQATRRSLDHRELRRLGL